MVMDLLKKEFINYQYILEDFIIKNWLKKKESDETKKSQKQQGSSPKGQT